jgi:hypothetical protein
MLEHFEDIHVYSVIVYTKLLMVLLGLLVVAALYILAGAGVLLCVGCQPS